jgi:hypothetical protein
MNADNTVQKSPEDDVIMVNGRPAKLKDVRVININGRPTKLVLGREYGFRMNSGCVPQPYEPKGAGCEPKRKRPKANVKIAKQTLAAMKLAKRKLSADAVIAAKQILVAKSLHAAIDAADAAAIERGYPLTDEELKQLGYVKLGDGVWELPISISIGIALREEKQPKKNA